MVLSFVVRMNKILQLNRAKTVFMGRLDKFGKTENYKDLILTLKCKSVKLASIYIGSFDCKSKSDALTIQFSFEMSFNFRRKVFFKITEKTKNLQKLIKKIFLFENRKCFAHSSEAVH